MSELRQIQEWYASQCNGDWEHSYGVKIDTLDNPGWIVSIDLLETDLQDRHFETINRGHCEDDADWISCSVDSGVFTASGGAGNLEELLRVFLTWAGR